MPGMSGRLIEPYVNETDTGYNANSRIITDTSSTVEDNKYIYTPVIIEENYLYISHLDEELRYWKLPCVPDTITDNMGANWTPNSALGRSAPVFTYSNSGPRVVHFEFHMHRDMMNDVNMSWSNSKLGYGEDYVDNLLHALQACVVPRYNLTNKAIEPPLVALRVTSEIFVKGVLNGAPTVTYGKPIFANGKFAQVDLSIDISEVDPYDAPTIYTNGSFRGMVGLMKRQSDKDFRMGDW